MKTEAAHIQAHRFGLPQKIETFGWLHAELQRQIALRFFVAEAQAHQQLDAIFVGQEFW